MTDKDINLIQTDVDLQSYQIPFAKVSQTAKRSNATLMNNDTESTQNNSGSFTDDDLFRSQDLFESQENIDNFTRVPVNHQDHILQNKLGMKCGQTIVRNTTDKDSFISTKQWSNNEDLPHPKKLFNRKRSKKLTPIVTEQPKEMLSREGQGVKEHLKQLMVKQSRRKTEKRLIVKFPFHSKQGSPNSLFESEQLSSPDLNLEHPHTSSKSTKFDKKIILHEESVSMSSWDEVETWIHQRWKSAGVSINRLEE